MRRAAAVPLCAIACPRAFAGAQAEEGISASVRAALSAALADSAAPEPAFPSAQAKINWLTARDALLARLMPDVRRAAFVQGSLHALRQ